MKDDTEHRSDMVPKLADVAIAAGVSTATVSRCLNSPNQVTEKTLHRVMEAVDRLGYSPNYSARALAARRTNTVGAIIPTMDNAIFARGVQAFQEELHRFGCTLLIASSSYEESLEEEQIKTLVARGADALLLIGYHRQERIYDFLERRQVPSLIAWACESASPHFAIGFDNQKSMKLLAMEVLLRGHRNIGFISASTASNDRARNRITGAKEAMAEYGLSPDDLKVVETTYSIENGSLAFRQLFDTDNPPTAVMCGNDVLAVGALVAAKEMNIRVPDDVSITGFDDIELARVAPVPLTTVHVPHRRMGMLAAQTIVDILGGKDTEQCKELPTQICIRETLGQARG